MLLSKRLLWAACACVFLLSMATAVPAQNVLVNPGFENGAAGGGARPDGWGWWGNAYQEGTYHPFWPLSGLQLCSMFGNWSGPWNTSGVYQEFATLAGAEWTLSSNARYAADDPILGVGAPNDNWVVQKIEFFDSGGGSLGAVEATILDGTYAPDTWHAAAPIAGTAPPGTVKVQALIIYIQPATAGGAAHIDDASFMQTGGPVPVENSTWGNIKALYGK